MPQLIYNPALELPPDYASPAYNIFTMQLAQARGVEKVVIVQELLIAWQEENNTRHAQWDLQIEEERKLAEEEETRQREEAERIVQEKEMEEATIRKEALKKQPQLVPILKSLWLHNSQPLRPSDYTICKLKKPEWVELWYFTTKGMQESSHQHSSADEEFTLAQ